MIEVKNIKKSFGDKIILKVDGEEPREFESEEEAKAEAAKLDASVGYEIHSEDPLNGTEGYNNTSTDVVESRPSFSNFDR